jgi:hypothetical protein
MNDSSVKKILKSISGGFPLGRGRIKEQSIKWNAECGFLAAHVAIVRGGEFPIVNFDLGVRHDAVEDMINAAKPLVTKSEARETCTIGYMFRDAKGLGLRDWIVRGDVPPESVGESIVEETRDDSILFFEKFQDLRRVYDASEKDDSDSRKYFPLASTRAMVAVSCSVLLSHPKSSVRRLVEIKRSVLQKGPQAYCDHFERFLSKNNVLNNL